MRKWVGMAVLALAIGHGGQAAAASFRVIHAFTAAEGGNPEEAVQIDSAGNMYGASHINGVAPSTVFRVAPDGAFTALTSMAGQASGGVTLMNDSTLFASTWSGTLYSVSTSGGGTIIGDGYGQPAFGMAKDPSGNALATGLYPLLLYRFDTNGTLIGQTAMPYVPNRGVGVDAAGNVWVTSGAPDWGEQSALMKVKPSGAVVKLAVFCAGMDVASTLCPKGAGLSGGPAPDGQGNVVVTAMMGGIDGACASSVPSIVYRTRLRGCGTVARVNAVGNVRLLHRFCSHIQAGSNICLDGAYPYAGVTIGSDGTVYGTTTAGGAFNQGVLFKISPGGTFKVLHSFCAKTACADGARPSGAPKIDKDGSLVGLTFDGGAEGIGVLYRYTP